MNECNNQPASLPPDTEKRTENLPPESPSRRYDYTSKTILFLHYFHILSSVLGHLEKQRLRSLVSYKAELGSQLIGSSACKSRWRSELG